MTAGDRGELTGNRERADARVRLLVETSCPLDLEPHQPAKVSVRSQGEQGFPRYAEEGEILVGEVDAAQRGVLRNVAEDIGQLHGDAEIGGVLGDGAAAANE